MKQRPHIIEIVGVAATGKSTLEKAMMQRNARIRPFDQPGDISYLPFLVKLAIIWLPLYLKEYRHTRWFTVQEIRNMAYLDTWISRIRHRAFLRDYIFTVEPGSVYWLSTLLGCGPEITKYPHLQRCGPEITKHPHFQRWWQEAFQRWASALDAIIWLDAPEEVCFERIHSRNQEHQFREYTAESATAHIKYDREYYQRVVPEMASQYPIKVFYFRTDQISTEQMVEQIFSDVEFWEKLDKSSRVV